MIQNSLASITRHPFRLFSTDHAVIGRQYFLLSLAAGTIGMLLSAVMRIRIVQPDLTLPFLGEIRPEHYLGFMTIHGTLMVFFVLTTAPQNAFGNLLIPAQIGSGRMAFPLLNALSFWMTFLALILMFASLVSPGGAPSAGWTQYAPLSALADAGPGQGRAMDLWLASLAIFCVASTMSAINFLSTILRMRVKGMFLMRMPLTVWTWLVSSALILLAFSVLLAPVVLLFSDRHFHTSFFLPHGLVVNGVLQPNAGGSPLLWQHLFWFFGHPEVYIAILPGMGVTSHLLSTFSRKPVFGYRAMVYSILAIGILGFAVWGHHMFTSGLHPLASFAFSTLTLVIAIPSSVKTINWLGTLWGSNLQLTTPMLFSIGFVSLFVTGGLSGPILAQQIVDRYLHDTYFVVAHFHMIMAMAGVFALYAATYFWFPQLSRGRLMHEGLGRLHFWLTFIGAYCTFMPMHFLGLAGHPRRYPQLAGSAEYVSALLPVQRFITVSAIVLVAAQVIFFVNLWWSFRRGHLAGTNPWSATTMEWSGSTEVKEVHCGPYEFANDGSGSPDFQPQWAASK